LLAATKFTLLRHDQRGALALLLCCTLLVVACAVGCHRRSTNLPQTFPVAGQVTRTDGEPLSGGAIYFRSPSHPALEATAEIGPDGRFELYTMAEGERLSGAVAGEHEVTVVPPGTPQDIMPAAVKLPDTQQVLPQPNELKLALP
jgi:hypothetical protein